MSRDFDAIIIGSGPGGSTAAEVLTGAGLSVLIFERGRNHLIDLENPAVLPQRLFQRRDQVHVAALPRTRPLGRAAHLPDIDRRRRPPAGRGGQQSPRDCRRRRSPRRRKAPPVPGGRLPRRVRARADGGGEHRRLAGRVRRDGALLRRGGKAHRGRGPGGRQPVRRLAIGRIPDATRRPRCTGRS